MNLSQCSFLFPIYINAPWAPFVVIPVQIAYLVWLIRCLLQILRVDALSPGWKLFWLAVVSGLPLIGPIAWLLSAHGPRPKRR
jgi:hypothetical protein